VVCMFKWHRLASLGIVGVVGQAVVVALMACVPAVAMAGTCSNEAVRVEQNASFLPECRAYELVSPPGAVPYVAPEGSINGARGGERFSTGDGRISWFSYYPPPGLTSESKSLLSTRDSGGWKTRDVMPPQSTSSGAFLGCAGYMYFSADLAKGVLADGHEQCPRNAPPLVENEPEGFTNLFLHDFSTGSYGLVNVTPANVAPAEAAFQDTSIDFTHVVFSENARLTPSAPSGEVLYEWIGGRVHLVSILPDGTAAPGELVDGSSESNLATPFVGFAPFVHSVSADGSRVIFESGGNLYVRENAEMEQSPLSSGGVCLESRMACTVQVDASATGGLGGGGSFIAATAQGTDVFFTDGGVKKLTSDTVGSSGQNLYEFDVETGMLTDLTPFATVGVLGLVGLGEEGSAWHLYVAAEGAFGDANAEGLQAQPNAPNLYEFSQGSPVAFIATLTPADIGDWGAEEPLAAASSNGRYLAFGSGGELTGYDNTPPQPADCIGSTFEGTNPEPCKELFRYDSAAGRLVCVSCGSANVRPTGPTRMVTVESAAVAGRGPGYLARHVLNDGRVIFDTTNALVASDVNGQNDVYIYEGGQAHLISSGTSTADSYFVEASGLNPLTGQEGEDVFFATSQHLLGVDTGNGPALYDARVEGGFPGGLGEAGEGQSCESAEECKPPAGEPPAAPLPASGALLAGGNLPPAVGAPTVKPLTRAQKLARALRACHRTRSRKKRAICEKRARRAYGRSK
jgi:hypothetical protein